MRLFSTFFLDVFCLHFCFVRKCLSSSSGRVPGTSFALLGKPLHVCVVNASPSIASRVCFHPGLPFLCPRRHAIRAQRVVFRVCCIHFPVRALPPSFLPFVCRISGIALICKVPWFAAMLTTPRRISLAPFAQAWGVSTWSWHDSPGARRAQHFVNRR